MPTAEQLFKPNLRGPLTSQMSGVGVTEQWCGRTTINSGTVFNTVSTALVGSESLIMITPEISSVDGTIAQSGSGAFVAVSSIVADTSFAVGAASGIAFLQDITVSWMIIPTK